jgi:hypothetical protein
LSPKRLFPLSLPGVLLLLWLPASFGQSNADDCLSCHGDQDLKARDGRPVGVEASALAASIHGRAGLGCLDCHRDLAGVTDFPHPPSRVLASGVSELCGRCHTAQTQPRRTGFPGSPLDLRAGSFHEIALKFGESRAASCASCHGSHEVRPSSDPLSAVHPANLPSTCGACHPGAGANVSKGRIHADAAGPAYAGPAVAEAFFRILIGGMTAVFLGFIALDLRRRWRER